ELAQRGGNGTGCTRARRGDMATGAWPARSGVRARRPGRPRRGGGGGCARGRAPGASPVAECRAGRGRRRDLTRSALACLLPCGRLLCLLQLVLSHQRGQLTLHGGLERVGLLDCLGDLRLLALERRLQPALLRLLGLEQLALPGRVLRERL